MEVLEKKSVLINKIKALENESLLDDLLNFMEDVNLTTEFKSKWDESNSPEVFLSNMKSRLSRLAEKYGKISA
jgi:hypothetical protein